MFAGTLVAGAAACIDAFYSGGKDTPQGPSFGAMMLAAWGVGAPLFLVVSLAAAIFSVIVHPQQPPCGKRAIQWLRDGDEPQSLNRAIMLPIAILGAWLWTTASAHIARALLSSIADMRVAGLAVAITTTGVAVAFVLVGLGVFAALHSTIFVRKQEVRDRFRAWWTGLLALVLCLAMALWGLATGSTGGEGGVFGFMGVLRRIELDLRVPAMLLAVAIGAYLAPRVRLAKGTWLAAAAAALLSFGPLGITVYTANSLNHAPKVVTTLEQSSPLGRALLARLRSITDRDGDGASPYFGGGDCDDSNSEIHPLAIEIPGDGIDQDCSGADLPKPTDNDEPQAKTDKNKGAHAPDATKSAIKNAVPDDLNVLLISVDTLRWDMGFMGYERPVSPAMDALAAKSTVFEHVYAMSSYTGKAIGPMMSGKYPSETNMGWSHYNKYPPSDRMVQERLQNAGVFTISLQCHWYFKKETGIGRGFDLFDISALPPQGIDATTDTTYSADRLSDAAIKVFSDPATTQKRFFAWMHYFDPHAEYLHHPGTEDFGRAKVRDMYDHEVRWTDDQIKRVLDFVEQQPWASKTAIILTGDHGEAFGEHGMYRHGFEVWDEIVRVPLIVYVPGVQPKRIKEKRSLIDLVPTILDLMKVEIGPPQDEHDFVSGKSLLDDVFSEPGHVPQQREILVDMPPGPFNQARRAYIRGDYKLIIAGGVRYQLFDLKNDPEEKKDLADDKQMLEQQRQHYDEFRAKLREVPLKRPK